jgi:hypothetical protein
MLETPATEADAAVEAEAPPPVEAPLTVDVDVDEAPEGETLRDTLTSEVRKSFDRQRAARGEVTADQFEPHRKLMTEHNISERNAVERWSRAERMLRETPGEGLAHLTRVYGSKLDQQGAARVIAEIAAAARLPIDREIVARAYASIEQEGAQRAVQWAQRTIDEFAADHPDLEQHRVAMGQLIQSGRADTIEDAYAQVTGLPAKAKAKVADDGKDDLRAAMRATRRSGR